MPLIGTAGHVDHGKSTLIQALTGRDPDRWREEKERGLTIDLGFAWLRLTNGTEVSFVDVPGHERYLKNMLAGVEAIDMALFVVAADEGWMPQSEEHLAVLDLLEVDRGVVALTKADLVDGELLELAELEVEDRLAGTCLSDAPVIPVSSTAGTGLDELLSHLSTLLSGCQPRDRGRPRLWVDRSFTVGGAGTVVTGSLLDGHLEVGHEVAVYPSGLIARIRGIQTHERTVDAVEPGRRVALNLAGIDRNQVSRGDMVGHPDHWVTSARFLTSLQPARYVEDIDQRGDYQLHIGSNAVAVDVVGRDEDAMVIRSATPVPIAVGDRFILRDTGRKLVVAGGRVLDPAPGATRAALETAASIDPTRSPNEIATRLLEVRGADTAENLEAHSGGGRPQGAVEADGQLLTAEKAESLRTQAFDAVQETHARHPLREGLPLATLAEQLGVSLSMAETIVDLEPALARTGPTVAAAGRVIELDESEEDTIEALRVRIASDLATPTVPELDLDPELLHLVIRRGDLVRVSGDLVYLPEQLERLAKTIRSMPDGFTVAQFRDATGLSRKYAVPILEWADKEGLTVRRGDTRSVR
jgi:selenocysteine-specific elongation factor